MAWPWRDRTGRSRSPRMRRLTSATYSFLNVLPCDLAEACLVKHVADYGSSLEVLFRDSPGCLCMPVVICIKAIECFKPRFRPNNADSRVFSITSQPASLLHLSDS